MVTIPFKMRYRPVSFLYVLDYSMNEEEQADWDANLMPDVTEYYDDTDYGIHDAPDYYGRYVS